MHYSIFFRRLAAALLCLTLLFSTAAAQTAVPPAADPSDVIQLVPTQDFPSLLGQEHTLAVYCVPVGAQDCYLIVCDGQAMVLDCAAIGREPSPDFLFQLLEGLGITRLAYAVNTHPHADHINGFPQLLEKIPADEFLTVFPPTYDKKQKRLLKALDQLNVPVRLYVEGQPLNLGSAQIDTYRYHKSKNTNDLSLVMHIRYGERTILLTADIGLTSQRKQAEKYGDAWKSDILKIPHHGVGGLSTDMLDIVDPKLCFMSNGKSTSNKLSRSLLEKRGLPYYLTARQCLVMVTDGTVWQVQQWEKDAIQLPTLHWNPHISNPI
ncbi:MAG: MBL fold metallo-hydrolase [Eubacteriales bacterium]|nr:MBL fold metallo-hydrolase [Eubacteriales bacterium]